MIRITIAGHCQGMSEFDICLPMKHSLSGLNVGYIMRGRAKPNGSRRLSELIRVPVRAQSTTHRVIHLVAGMLCELHVDLLDPEGKDVDARLDELLRQFGSLFGRTPFPYIAHEKSRLIGLVRRAAP